MGPLQQSQAQEFWKQLYQKLILALPFHGSSDLGLWSSVLKGLDQVGSWSVKARTMSLPSRSNSRPVTSLRFPSQPATAWKLCIQNKA